MTEPRICAAPGCGQQLKSRQRKYCSRACLGRSHQRGQWVECARPGCHNSLYLTPSRARRAGRHYCSRRCRSIGMKSPQVICECPICGEPVIRSHTIMVAHIRHGRHPCCRASCVGLYAILMKAFKKHGPDGIRQECADEVLRWLEERGGGIPVARLEAAFEFARHLADKAIKIFTTPLEIVENRVVTRIKFSD